MICASWSNCTCRTVFSDIPAIGYFAQAQRYRDAQDAGEVLAPAQDQKVMILGGGEVGESPVSTARTDVIDLSEQKPRYRPGPDLPAPARYLSTVLLPDDTVLTTGGSSGTRWRRPSRRPRCG